MKTVYAFLMILLLPAAIMAQKTVSAQSIISSINNNTAVNLSDVQVTGDLDLTKLDNMKLAEQNSSNKMYVSTVSLPLNFTNCSFTGKVLGYVNPDTNKPFAKSSTVYNANFTTSINFKNCVFEKEVNFKYSQFNDDVSFAACTFNDEATFKYTKF